MGKVSRVTNVAKSLMAPKSDLSKKLRTAATSTALIAFSWNVTGRPVFVAIPIGSSSRWNGC
jgi:hypothetical protein